VKRPAFQFYPADYRKDPALASCSLAARGLWVELLCVMHESDCYGVLVVNGRAMDGKQIARLVGESPATVSKLLAELEAAGVPSRNADGALYSRRMVKDEEVRQRRAEGGVAGGEFGHLGAGHGSKGGRPRKETGDKKPPSNPPLKPPPSSSSSSSASSSSSLQLESSSITGSFEAVDTHRERVSATPTLAGEVCRAMRAAGLADTNPSHPTFIALIEAGATPAQFAHAAKTAASKGKGFAYALGTLKGQLTEASAMPQAVRDHNHSVAAEWLAAQQGVPQ